MDMEHKIPKKVVLATHGDGEPPKTLYDGYMENIKYNYDNLDKSPFNLIIGDTLDHLEYFRDYRLSQKGEHLCDKMEILCCFVWNLC